MVPKKRLDTVTLLGVDCVNFKRLQLAADICQQAFDFKDVKLLTSIPSRDPRHVAVKPILSLSEYSKFMIAELDSYVDTPHVLIIQYDGFILNPDAWSDEFLNYDYIGSPWLVTEKAMRDGFKQKYLGKSLVGNGGFSLRSKKLLSACVQLDRQGKIPRYQPEDVVICSDIRESLESLGIRFAPLEVASRFSFEKKRDSDVGWDGEFGYHGFRWTDISKWTKDHPEIYVNPKKNIIRKSWKYSLQDFLKGKNHAS